LATDELIEITGLGAEEATALIMRARQHWFTTDQDPAPSSQSQDGQRHGEPNT